MRNNITEKEVMDKSNKEDMLLEASNARNTDGNRNKDRCHAQATMCDKFVNTGRDSM